MPAPTIEFLGASYEVSTPGERVVRWNARLVTSDGFVHHNADGYRLAEALDELGGHHSPEARELLELGDVEDAIELDMQRALAELEARLTVAPPDVLVLSKLVAGTSYDASGKALAMPDVKPAKGLVAVDV